MTRRTGNFTLALALAGAVTLSTAAGAMAAGPTGAHSGNERATSMAAPGTVSKRPSVQAAPVVSRAVRAPKLVVSGTLKAVSSAGAKITVTVQGGRDKSARGQDVVIAVGTATVLRQDGVAVAASGLRVGGHVSVQCVRAADGSLTAIRVTAEVGHGDPSDTSTPTPVPTSTSTTAPSAASTS